MRRARSEIIAADAFFVAHSPGVFLGTAHTTGPWDPGAMHFGPPAALLGRALEDAPSEVPKRIARVAFDILRPVPVAELTLAATVLRPGKRVDLVEARLAAGGQDVAIARAWRVRTAPVAVPELAVEGPPTPPPDAGETVPIFGPDLPAHYGRAMELRSLSGSPHDPGPGVAWFRPRIALIEGEPLRPLDRVLLVADSGNGLSAVAHPEHLVFINTELTVHLHRYPVGEWVCMNSRTTMAPDGIGVAESVLSDEVGRFGRAAQALFLDNPR